MKIKLNVDYTVCLDGIRPSSFAAGQEVDIPVHIASVLLGDGRASLPIMETKDKGPAPENKMLSGSPKNKRRRR